MSYTVRITNLSDNTTEKQTFSVKMDSGKCEPSSGNVPKVGEKPVILTAEPNDATGTIIFSLGGKLTLKQRMDAGKYPDGEDSLWVNQEPPGQKDADERSAEERSAEERSAEEGNDVKVTRP